MYFLRNLPWLIRNSRRYPGLLRGAFIAGLTGKSPLIA